MCSQMARFHPFVWLSNIPLCVTPHPLYPFIYQWALQFRLLPCLSYYNYTAVNMRVQIFELVFSFPLSKLPEGKSLDHMVVPSLTFWGASILFSIAATPICIPTSGAQGFPFLHFLTNTCLLLSVWWQPFWHVWGKISLWLWFASPWWVEMAHWVHVCERVTQVPHKCLSSTDSWCNDEKRWFYVEPMTFLTLSVLDLRWETLLSWVNNYHVFNLSI